MRSSNFVACGTSLLLICVCCSVSATYSSVIAQITVPGHFEFINTQIQPGLKAEIAQRVQQKQELVDDDVVVAVAKVRRALLLIDNKEIDAAKKQLAQALSKIKAVLDRSPEQDLVPIQVSHYVRDDLTNLDIIRSKKQEIDVQWQLNHIQIARRLLDGFASDAVITVQNITLNSFVQEITKARLSLSEHNIEDTGQALTGVLKSIVQTVSIIPLPLFRAELMIKESEQITQQMDMNKQFDKARLQWLLENAKYQMQLGEALGYGDQRRYKKFYQAVEGVMSLVAADQQPAMLLKKLRSVVTALKNEVIDELSYLPYN